MNAPAKPAHLAPPVVDFELDGRPAQAATWGRVDGAATIAAPADGCGAPRVTTTAGAVQTVTPTGSSDATPAGERP